MVTVPTEDGDVTVAMSVPRSSRTTGGPITCRITGPGVDLVCEWADWLVTTNRGWAHLRGKGRSSDRTVPFRCDAYSARANGEDGPDVLAIRIYAPDADPGTDGPVAKLTLSLPSGSVRLGA